MDFLEYWVQSWILTTKKAYKCWSGSREAGEEDKRVYRTGLVMTDE